MKRTIELRPFPRNLSSVSKVYQMPMDADYPKYPMAENAKHQHASARTDNEQSGWRRVA